MPTPTHREPLRLGRAYSVACEADKAFQAELVRQFGKESAGDYRYRRNTHDQQTAAARDAFQSATDEMIAAMREAGTP